MNELDWQEQEHWIYSEDLSSCLIGPFPNRGAAQLHLGKYRIGSSHHEVISQVVAKQVACHIIVTPEDDAKWVTANRDEMRDENVLEELDRRMVWVDEWLEEYHAAWEALKQDGGHAARAHHLIMYDALRCSINHDELRWWFQTNVEQKELYLEQTK